MDGCTRSPVLVLVKSTSHEGNWFGDVELSRLGVFCVLRIRIENGVFGEDTTAMAPVLVRDLSFVVEAASVVDEEGKKVIEVEAMP